MRANFVSEKSEEGKPVDMCAGAGSREAGGAAGADYRWMQSGGRSGSEPVCAAAAAAFLLQQQSVSQFCCCLVSSLCRS